MEMARATRPGIPGLHQPHQLLHLHDFLRMVICLKTKIDQDLITDKNGNIIMKITL